MTKEYVSLKGSNRINTQLLDSILIGIARNIENAKLNEQGFLSDKINTLKDSIDSDENGLGKYWSSRRTSKENIAGRCDLVAEKFSE